MLHIYHGNGKGKTTAAVGLAVRLVAYDKRALFIQFLKDGTSGEVQTLKHIHNIDVFAQYDSKQFYFQMNKEEKEACANVQRNVFQFAQEHSKHYDLIILDEVLDAMHLNIIKKEDLLAYLHMFKEKHELVFTGRNPGQELLDCADYVSEMVMEKHPYDKGVPARAGIEY